MDPHIPSRAHVALRAGGCALSISTMAAPQPVTVVVRDVRGQKDMEVLADLGTTIGEVKKQIELLHDCRPPAASIKLIYAGTVLVDSSTLAAVLGPVRLQAACFLRLTQAVSGASVSNPFCVSLPSRSPLFHAGFRAGSRTARRPPVRITSDPRAELSGGGLDVACSRQLAAARPIAPGLFRRRHRGRTAGRVCCCSYANVRQCEPRSRRHGRPSTRGGVLAAAHAERRQRVARRGLHCCSWQ